jgi:hypothetical protein
MFAGHYYLKGCIIKPSATFHWVHVCCELEKSTPFPFGAFCCALEVLGQGSWFHFLSISGSRQTSTVAYWIGLISFAQAPAYKELSG